MIYVVHFVHMQFYCVNLQLNYVCKYVWLEFINKYNFEISNLDCGLQTWSCEFPHMERVCPHEKAQRSIHQVAIAVECPEGEKSV